MFVYICVELDMSVWGGDVYMHVGSDTGQKFTMRKIHIYLLC